MKFTPILLVILFGHLGQLAAKKTSQPTLSPVPTTTPPKGPSNSPTEFPSLIPTHTSIPSQEPTLDAADIRHYTEPFVRWKHQLTGGFESIAGPSLRKGNAVVVSPNNDQVYVTSDDGRIHILPTELTRSWVPPREFSPSIIQKNNVNWFTVCYSGVSLYQTKVNARPVTLAVYAVIDMPPRKSNNKIQRYVVVIQF